MGLRRSGRAGRRWERELLREIRAMDTAAPHDGTHDHEVEPVSGRVRRPPRAPGLRRTAARRPRPVAWAAAARTEPERRRTLLTVGLTLTVILALGAVSLGPLAPHTRELLGLGGRHGGKSSDHAYIHTDLSGDPAGFDPCRPIHYVVNADDAPDDWASLLDPAIAAVSQATGLRFIDDGTTSDRNFFDRRDPRTGAPEPVLIGWASSREVPGLDKDVAGLTSSDWNPATNRYDTGTVALDVDDFRSISTRAGGGRRGERAVIMHELGHLVGLDHVDTRSELMYPEAGYRFDYGPGDLAGLAAIGSIAC